MPRQALSIISQHGFNDLSSEACDEQTKKLARETILAMRFTVLNYHAGHVQCSDSHLKRDVIDLAFVVRLYRLRRGHLHACPAGGFKDGRTITTTTVSKDKSGKDVTNIGVYEKVDATYVH